MTTASIRRVGVVVGGLALAAATLVGCSKAESTPKNIGPTTSLYPSYSPTVKAPAAPTALPGNVITGN